MATEIHDRPVLRFDESPAEPSSRVLVPEAYVEGMGRGLVVDGKHHVAGGEAEQGTVVALGDPHGILGVGQEPLEPWCQRRDGSGVIELSHEGVPAGQRLGWCSAGCAWRYAMPFAS